MPLLGMIGFESRYGESGYSSFLGEANPRAGIRKRGGAAGVDGMTGQIRYDAGLWLDMGIGAVPTLHGQFRLFLDAWPSQRIRIAHVITAAEPAQRACFFCVDPAGRLEFWHWGTATPFKIGEASISVRTWYLVRFRVSPNQLTYSGGGPWPTNAEADVWLDTQQVVEWRPTTTSINTGLLRGGSNVITTLTLDIQRHPSDSGTPVFYLSFDDFLASTQPLEGEHVVRLRPSSGTGWTRPELAGMPWQVSATMVSTSNTPLQVGTWTFQLPEGCPAPSRDEVLVQLVPDQVWTVPTVELIIDGTPHTASSVYLGESGRTNIALFNVGTSITTASTIQVRVTKDDTTNSRGLSELSLYLLVDAPYDDPPVPSQDVVISAVQWTGDGAAVRYLALDADVLFVTGASTEATVYMWTREQMMANRLRTSPQFGPLKSDPTNIFILPGASGVYICMVGSTINVDGRVYRGVAIKDPSMRVVKRGAVYAPTEAGTLVYLPEGAPNASLFIVIPYTDSLTARASDLCWRTSSHIGDRTISLYDARGATTGLIQDISPSTGFLHGGVLNLSEWGSYVLIDAQQFSQLTLAEVVSWTGTGATSQVITLQNQFLPGFIMMGPVTGSSNSSTIYQSYIWMQGLAAGESRLLNGGMGVTYAVTDVSTGSFTVGTASAAGIPYTAFVMALGTDVYVSPNQASWTMQEQLLLLPQSGWVDSPARTRWVWTGAQPETCPAIEPADRTTC